ncbi:hypothetical protein M422DRAFT_252908 [Sphaerobolus stellatus SS14]|uniref:DUF6532 domain-containing protein n=1 Tax=Sphaerobolus stellatus (strain SS14) TaxID=990650 RepID=A0A0C9VNP6_SPHS4|nr:hypothetical protein M422DRAFT_252908 [Sphaerobolus stellatus SS14]
MSRTTGYITPEAFLQPSVPSKDAFDPLCLETLAFVCTMTHFALANLLKEKQQEFSADEYFLIYIDYLEMLKDFQAEEPEEFENRLMIMLADGKKNLGNAEKVILKKKQTAGLSGDTLKKELSMMTAAQPSQVPQGMAVAAVLAPHGSTTAAIGNISQPTAPLPAFGVPYPAPYHLFILLFPKVFHSQTSLIAHQSRAQDMIYALYLVHGVSA